MLQSQAGWEYFPYVFGVFDGKLGMELITYNDKKVVTVSNMQKTKILTSGDWNVFCFSLASAVKYMHLKNLSHNDLMLNNALLKLRNILRKKKYVYVFFKRNCIVRHYSIPRKVKKASFRT